MKFTCLFDCVYCFCCYFAVIIFFKRFTESTLGALQFSGVTGICLSHWTTSEF